MSESLLTGGFAQTYKTTSQLWYLLYRWWQWTPPHHGGEMAYLDPDKDLTAIAKAIIDCEDLPVDGVDREPTGVTECEVGKHEITFGARSVVGWRPGHPGHTFHYRITITRWVESPDEELNSLARVVQPVQKQIAQWYCCYRWWQ